MTNQMAHQSQKSTRPYQNSSLLPLVKTTRAPTFPRDRERYDSSERLPGIETILDSTAKKILHIHETRLGDYLTLDKLWDRVCKNLAKLGNASAYAHWKQTDVIKNTSEFAALDEEIARAWSKLYMANPSENGNYYTCASSSEFQSLKTKRANLKAKAKGSLEHPLEVAIAYWIEAKNAHNESNDIRALHALIECHFYLGIAHAPRTEYETKRETGKKAGQKERDTIADVVLKIMQQIKVDASIRNQDELIFKITRSINSNPQHLTALNNYDDWATCGKHAQGSTEERFSETLRKWIWDKKQPYPEITTLFLNLSQHIGKKSPITKNTSRKASN
ncbi:MAG: hypothetical protein QM769_04915 [Pseudoxanthomonas sp.]